MTSRWGALASTALLLIAGSVAADDDLPNAVPTVMHRRWAASLAYGASTVRARAEDAQWDTLAYVDMALRYRVLPQLELGASMGGSFT